MTDTEIIPKHDKYDDAIAYLNEHPEEIYDAWVAANKHEAGCLFRFVTNNGRSKGSYGCLTTIRCFATYGAETPELTVAIKADERIPLCPNDIKLSDLSVFVEWQRRIDKELNRSV